MPKDTLAMLTIRSTRKTLDVAYQGFKKHKAEEIDGEVEKLLLHLIELDTALLEFSTLFEVGRLREFELAREQIREYAISINDSRDDRIIVQEELKIIIDIIDELLSVGSYTNMYISYKGLQHTKEINREVVDEPYGYFKNAINEAKRPLNIFVPFYRGGRETESCAVNQMDTDFASHNLYMQSADDAYTSMLTHFKKIHSHLTEKNTKVSNEVFDVLYMIDDPELYLPDYATQISNTSEQVRLRQTAKYLREGGLLYFVMPKGRLNTKNARELIKFFDDLKIHTYKPKRLSAEEFYIVTGYKKPEKRCIFDDDAQKTRLTQLLKEHFSEVFKEIREGSLQFTFKSEPLDVTMFRSGKIEEQDIASLTMDSPLLENAIELSEDSLNKNRRKQPLLPFNLGQLGLVLASGELDGYIDEGDGHGHAIRGRVVRNSERTVIEDGGKTKEVTVEKNVVQINCLLPSGRLKTIV